MKVSGASRRKRLFRLAALAAALPVAAACNNTGNSTYAQFYQIARQSLAATVGGVRVTREQAAKIPYASLGYRINEGNEGLLVLATDTGGDLLWTSASRVVIVTRDGRIVRSVGLDRDVSNLTYREGAAQAPANALKAPFSTTRLADFTDLGLYGVTITCTARAAARQSVRILGQVIATVRVDETCRSNTRNWSFTDSFWVDPASGLAWRSRQHVHPQGGVVDIQIFRPPG